MLRGFWPPSGHKYPIILDAPGVLAAGLQQCASGTPRAPQGAPLDAVVGPDEPGLVGPLPPRKGALPEGRRPAPRRAPSGGVRAGR